ncbi:hypothetical protein OH773_13035 [Buttiauxella sp. WJP83]|uniref:hypothetical protein n=1 Tax=Buttiauxella sp. WJP83 TaxID=2986951 RepID=UPI0022DCFD94|nr:hypothetical protein [Buttiauxella sp. WJP83]WBM69114.1 hypothetical protein OH773_13035 [Buttiauxella sp. WJP83]
MKRYVVALRDGTVGDLYADTVKKGDLVTVWLRDADGNPTYITEIVEKIIKEDELLDF